MGNDLENFDFLELGQAIQDAREKQRITREELAEELGISARHLQSIEKEGQYPSFRLFIQLVTMFHISVDQYILHDLGNLRKGFRLLVYLLVMAVNLKAAKNRCS